MNKAFIDSNLLLRFLINDIPEQAVVLESLFQKARDKKVELVCNSMVVAEIVWTLESFYGFAKDKIQDVVSALVYLDLIHFDERQILLQALDDYVHLNIDFIDAYIAAWMEEQDIKNIYTFNKKHFKRIPTVNLPEFPES